jgi:hypothetical protein
MLLNQVTFFIQKYTHLLLMTNMVMFYLAALYWAQLTLLEQA